MEKISFNQKCKIYMGKTNLVITELFPLEDFSFAEFLKISC